MVTCGGLQYVDGHLDTIENPSLVVEVLSVSTERYDRTAKFALYRNVTTLNEYVLVSQDEKPSNGTRATTREIGSTARPSATTASATWRFEASPSRSVPYTETSTASTSPAAYSSPLGRNAPPSSFARRLPPDPAVERFSQLLHPNRLC